MTFLGWVQIVLYCAIVLALVQPLGWYMTRVFNGERTFLAPVLRPVETVLYRVAGVDPAREQHWLAYTIAMLFFHVGGFLILYALMRLQTLLPFNPAGQSAVAEDLSFNTAVSFITNTNWQNYGGESTSKASSRRSRWGRSPRRSRSRCSAPTAAVSSTPMPRTRSRIPRRFPTSSR